MYINILKEVFIIVKKYVWHTLKNLLILVVAMFTPAFTTGLVSGIIGEYLLQKLLLLHERPEVSTLRGGFDSRGAKDQKECYLWSFVCSNNSTKPFLQVKNKYPNHVTSYYV